MQQGLIVAVDQGTSATKGAVVDGAGRIVARASCALSVNAPRPGWVEQDPEEIWSSTAVVLDKLLSGASEAPVGIALSTQRESVLTWDARTGQPLAPVLSWQDRRAADWCEALANEPDGDTVASLSGLPVDPMFSGPKLRWLLQHDDAVREAARTGRLRVGTVDSWLLWRLTGGAHLSEIGNASRTQLLSIERSEWDPRLLEIFEVPPAALPAVSASSGPFGVLGEASGLPRSGLPILAVLGDSHAALFAHGGSRLGVAKATLGTGASVMATTPVKGPRPGGLAHTIAWQLGLAPPTYALEGNIASAGATVRWLAQILDCDDAEVQRLAEHAEPARDAEVVLVPAFNGLGAPYWDRSARAVLVGMALGTGRADLALAAIRAIAYQVAETFALIADTLGSTSELRVDGGASRNDHLLQFLADLSERRVSRSTTPEASALGAAYLAGMATGQWSQGDIEAAAKPAQTFTPAANAAWRDAHLENWRDALARARLSPGGPASLRASAPPLPED